MWKRVLVPVGLVLAASAIVVVPRTGVQPNDADRAFVAEMIPHHMLGMRLIDEATQHSDDVRLRRMVFEMSTYHASELDHFERWSSEWGVAPASDFPGDLPKGDLRDLAELDGPAHDTEWLALMLEHHRGALEITEAEGDGAIASARAMAETIHSVQAQQITEMTALLADLCADHPGSPGCQSVALG